MNGTQEFIIEDLLEQASEPQNIECHAQAGAIRIIWEERDGLSSQVVTKSFTLFTTPDAAARAAILAHGCNDSFVAGRIRVSVTRL
jgi:hypothetical protein